jgi:hypothetical protein
MQTRAINQGKNKCWSERAAHSKLLLKKEGKEKRGRQKRGREKGGKEKRGMYQHRGVKLGQRQGMLERERCTLNPKRCAARAHSSPFLLVNLDRFTYHNIISTKFHRQLNKSAKRQASGPYILGSLTLTPSASRNCTLAFGHLVWRRVVICGL